MKYALALGALIATASALTAKADPVADFYKGKTVSIVVGHEVGTGFDVYSRVLIRHMGKHIPGNPNMIVQNMLGASGVTSANWLYNVAPKDGTVMGTFAQTVPIEPLFGNQSARYDAARLIWIGNMESSVAICGVTKASGVKTFDDMKKREVLIGATGPTGPLVKSALAVKNILGAQIKVIPGYKGSADVKLAMNRGELQGICGLPWSTVKSFWKQELDSGDFLPIIQLSGAKSSEIPGVPHVNDFIKTDRDRALSGLLFGVQELGRVYAAPPDTPADRVAALRKAFMATMSDKDFLADATKTGIDIIPMDGEVLTKLWTEFTSTPAALVEEAKKATTP
ncbi:MAG: Bug family tripartite tricarboxylate transporter substrate binding protein [Beijerinckiaceae bacterium]